MTNWWNRQSRLAKFAFGVVSGAGIYGLGIIAYRLGHAVGAGG